MPKCLVETVEAIVDAVESLRYRVEHVNKKSISSANALDQKGMENRRFTEMSASKLDNQMLNLESKITDKLRIGDENHAATVNELKGNKRDLDASIRAVKMDVETGKR
jgi:hypothetical protein